MSNAVAEKPVNEVAVVRQQLEGMGTQFAAALPKHIPVERFARVVMTAIQNNPDLMHKVDRRSLWNSAMKAAQDGLLPDGREGALVIYGSAAQWMPMIAGLRKKVRNSGEIATWDTAVVFEKDRFRYRLGDEPFIEHEPYMDGDPGKVKAAYSIAVLKSGEKTREVMSVNAIEKIRQRSRAKNNGPWVTDYEEMCRKTVARRHSKVLPMSTDLDDLLRRDDDLYQFNEAKEEAKASARPTLVQSLDQLAALPEPTPEPKASKAKDEPKEADASAATASENQDEASTDQSDADVADDASLTLLERAHTIALQGKSKFVAWHGKLTEAEANELSPEFAKLKRAAEAVDRERAA